MRPDRRPVVAVLGVVVVLDHERAPRRAPSAARRRGARRESTAPVGHWWEGVRTSASASRAVERVDADAVFVDRHPDDLQAGRARERKRVVVRRRVLEREPLRAGRRERLDEQPDPLGVAVADHDVLGPGGRASHAIEVRRERLVQRRARRGRSRSRTPRRTRSVRTRRSERSHAARGNCEPSALHGQKSIPAAVGRQRRWRSRGRLGADRDPGVSARPGLSGSPRR